MATLKVDGELHEVEVIRHFEPQKRSGGAAPEPGGFAFTCGLMLPIRPKQCEVLEGGVPRPILVRPLPTGVRRVSRKPIFEYLATYNDGALSPEFTG